MDTEIFTKLQRDAIRDYRVAIKDDGAMTAEEIAEAVMADLAFADADKTVISKAVEIIDGANDSKIDEMKSMYLDQGLSLNAIAVKMQISHATVARKLRQAGIEIRTRGSQANEDGKDKAKRDKKSYSKGNKAEPASKEKIEKLYFEQGMTVREISKEFGVASSTLLKWMDEYGIERRVGGRPKEKEVAKVPMVEEKVTISDEMVTFSPAAQKVAQEKLKSDAEEAADEYWEEATAKHIDRERKMLLESMESQTTTENEAVLDSLYITCGRASVGVLRDKYEIDTVEYSKEEACDLLKALTKALTIDIDKILI